MMPLNHILKKCTRGYKLIKSQEKINHLMYMDDIIRTYNVKVRIDKTQQNGRCRLCSDRDETINHIITKSCKLAQRKYRPRHG